MRLQSERKPTVKVPHGTHNGFYACPCGNRFTSYMSQEKCEACGAVLDWDSVLASYEGRERKEKNGNKK